MKKLPIGTVCTIKGNNKKVMIIGYCVSSFEQSLKKYDYSAVCFPEGTLLSNRFVLFNQIDIKTIEYMGFENEEYENFVDMLNIYIKQDEILEEDFKKKKDMFNNPESSFSKLVFDENGVVMIAEQVNTDEDDKYTFDENGYVVKEKAVEPINPFVSKKYPETDSASLNDIINQSS